MNLFVSPKEYFSEVVREGLRHRRINTLPRIEDYLVDLLQHYLETRNLFEPEHDESGQRRPQTLAEMYLTAGQLEAAAKVELLKKLGDRSLYISGFFGDSLVRKVVDVDYYVDMGGTAYGQLASQTRDETLARVYQVFSSRFVEFVDVLTYVSQKSMVRSNESVLRLYERYLRTGSELAREKLNEMGVVTVPKGSTKISRPF